MAQNNVHKRAALQDRLFAIFGAVLTLSILAILLFLILDLLSSGFSRLSWSFLTSFPSRFPDKAGILSAWVGSCLVIVVCLVTIIFTDFVLAFVYNILQNYDLVQ